MTEPTQNQQEEGHAPPDPLENIFSYLRQAAHSYGRMVVAAGVAVVLVVVGVQTYRSRVQSESAVSWAKIGRLENYAQQKGKQKGKQLDSAIKEYETMLEKRWETSATPWILLKLGNARREAGRLNEALSAYRRLREEYGNSMAASMAAPALAGTLEEMGRYEEAAREYEKLAAKENDARYYLNAGRCWQLSGAFEKAKKDYQRAREEAGSERTEISELAEFGLNAVARGDKLTVPDRPAQAQPPTGLQGMGTTAPAKGKQGAAPKQPTDTTKTKNKQTD